jgi:hypothetical protein
MKFYGPNWDRRIKFSLYSQKDSTMKRILSATAALLLVAFVGVSAADKTTWGQVKAEQNLAPAAKLIFSGAKAGGPVDVFVSMAGRSDPPDFTAVFTGITEPDKSFIQSIDWTWIQTGNFVGAQGRTIPAAGDDIIVCGQVRGSGVLRNSMGELGKGEDHFVVEQLAVQGNRAAFVVRVTSINPQIGEPNNQVGDELLIWIEDGIDGPDRKLAIFSIDAFKELNPDMDLETDGPPAGILRYMQEHDVVNTPFGPTEPFEWANGGVRVF